MFLSPLSVDSGAKTSSCVVLKLFFLLFLFFFLMFHVVFRAGNNGTAVCEKTQAQTQTVVVLKLF